MDSTKTNNIVSTVTAAAAVVMAPLSALLTPSFDELLSVPDIVEDVIQCAIGPEMLTSGGRKNFRVSVSPEKLTRKESASQRHDPLVAHNTAVFKVGGTDVQLFRGDQYPDLLNCDGVMFWCLSQSSLDPSRFSEPKWMDPIGVPHMQDLQPQISHLLQSCAGLNYRNIEFVFGFKGHKSLAAAELCIQLLREPELANKFDTLRIHMPSQFVDECEKRQSSVGTLAGSPPVKILGSPTRCSRRVVEGVSGEFIELGQHWQSLRAPEQVSGSRMPVSDRQVVRLGIIERTPVYLANMAVHHSLGAQGAEGVDFVETLRKQTHVERLDLTSMRNCVFLLYCDPPCPVSNPPRPAMNIGFTLRDQPPSPETIVSFMMHWAIEDGCKTVVFGFYFDDKEVTRGMVKGTIDLLGTREFAGVFKQVILAVPEQNVFEELVTQPKQPSRLEDLAASTVKTHLDFRDASQLRLPAKLKTMRRLHDGHIVWK